MKTNSMILALVSSLTLTAAAGAAQAQDTGKSQRGSVLVEGRNAKAVVVGPVAIHAYSAFSGAKLFVVNAVSGTDSDCAVGAPAATPVVADHVETLTVGAGQVACVATTSTRGSELLWHVRKTDAASTLLASRR